LPKKRGLKVIAKFEITTLAGGVNTSHLGGGSRSVPALLSGSIEVFLGSDTAGYTANLQGKDLVKLGVAMNTTGYSVVT